MKTLKEWDAWRDSELIKIQAQYDADMRTDAPEVRKLAQTTADSCRKLLDWAYNTGVIILERSGEE